MKLQVKPTGRMHTYSKRLLLAAICAQGVLMNSLATAQELTANVRPAEAVRIGRGIRTQPEKRKIGASAESTYSVPPTPIDAKAAEPVKLAEQVEKGNTAASRPVELLKRRGAKISVSSRESTQTNPSLTLPPMVAESSPIVATIPQPAFLIPETIGPSHTIAATPLTAPVHSLQLPPQSESIASKPAVIDVQIVEPPQLVLRQTENIARIAQSPAANVTSAPSIVISPPTTFVPQSVADNVKTSHITHSDQATPAAFASASIAKEDLLLEKSTIYQRRLTSNKFEQVVTKTVSYDESTCRAFIVDSHTIALLGVKTGQAKIDVMFADGTKSTRLISVENAISRGEAVDHREKIASLTRSLSEMYPNASITLKPEANGSIAVRGELKNDNDARDVMLLVRQVFLVPIQDKLVVSYR